MIHVTGTPSGLWSPFVLYDNALARGALVASSTAAGSYPQDILGPQTYDAWTPAALPATMELTLGASETLDACGIVAHNIGSTGATVYVERWTGSAWAVVASAAPTDDSCLVLVWAGVAAAQWRLRITGTVTPSIGVAILGQRLSWPCEVAPPYVPADAAQRIEAGISRSLGGQFLGASVWRRGLEMEANFSPIARGWVDGDMRPFREHYDLGGPFFWSAWAAGAPRDVAYCWRPEGASELRAAYDAGGLYATVTMRMAGYGA